MVSRQNKIRNDPGSIRETVESVWIAIVLAFVLRAFVVEAFVIPTGSMAPRLMGEHWDLQCPSCGHDYAFGWRGRTPPARNRLYTPTGAHCPSCGHAFPYTDRPAMVNNGDRVLVLKYLYQFTEPRVWDVVVFRNPQGNRDNYIKRLVGLPGETLEILHGDIFIREGSGKGRKWWQVRRKPPDTQEAMWQVVFDNDYRPNPAARGFIDGTSPSWWASGKKQARRFVFDGTDKQAELTFRASREHFKPNYGYNALAADRDPKAFYTETDVCGDLKLSAVFIPKDKNPSAEIDLLLNTGRNHFKARIRTDGNVTLYRQNASMGNWEAWVNAKTEPLKADRGYEVAISHADFRVTISINGKAVLHKDHDNVYRDIKERLENYENDLKIHGTISYQLAQKLFPTPQLKILLRGGPSELRHLKVFRDVYYTCRQLERTDLNPLDNYASRKKNLERINKRTDVWGRSDPEGIASRGWGVTGRPIRLAKNKDDPDLDEFFVLGDNSPQSLDARMWTRAAPTLRLLDKDGKEQYQLGTVPRYNMIGKAVFVYWPAGFRPPSVPSLPIIPNVGRMRFIR